MATNLDPTPPPLNASTPFLTVSPQHTVPIVRTTRGPSARAEDSSKRIVTWVNLSPEQQDEVQDELSRLVLAFQESGYIGQPVEELTTGRSKEVASLFDVAMQGIMDLTKEHAIQFPNNALLGHGTQILFLADEDERVLGFQLEGLLTVESSDEEAIDCC